MGITDLWGSHIDNIIHEILYIWNQVYESLELPFWYIFLFEQNTIIQDDKPLNLYTHQFRVYLCIQISQFYLHQILQSLQTGNYLGSLWRHDSIDKSQTYDLIDLLLLNHIQPCFQR